MSEGTPSATLSGKRIGVTAARKADELIDLLRRRGAEVLHAPAIDYVDLAEDPQLRAATEQVIAERTDLVVITTGMGFRGWLDAARGAGLVDRLLEQLGSATIYTRGPKATGAVRAAGLRERYSPASETDAELLAELCAHPLRDKRCVIQAHGEPLGGFVEELRGRGARVLQVLPYRWRRPDDPRPLRTLIAEVLAGRVDALAFTSAPAVSTLLEVAIEDEQGEGFIEALRSKVLVACVGSVTAAPLARYDIPSIAPQRARTAALVRTLTDALA
ncbi:MAG: uroporphyrinogen-III synthase [Sciscionella sp.]